MRPTGHKGKHQLGQSGKIQLDLTGGPNSGQIKNIFFKSILKNFIHMQTLIPI